MPTYEYRCTKGHTFEVMQSMTDEPLTKCTECNARVQRVFHPVAVHFKGSGFYTTDYGRKKRADAKEKATSSNGSADSGSSDKKDKPEKKKEKTASSE
jgi:putative FmdB family regulatory protein